MSYLIALYFVFIFHFALLTLPGATMSILLIPLPFILLFLSPSIPPILSVPCLRLPLLLPQGARLGPRFD